MVSQGFVLPLRAAQPPIIDQLDSFLVAVLLNIAEIRDHSAGFLETLLARQREDPVVYAIGDIILAAAVEWGPAYTAFTTNFPYAESRFKEEKAKNPLFVEFLLVRTIAFRKSHV